jgi:hypothetical protein
VQDGYGVLFAVRVQFLLCAGGIAVQSFVGAVTITVYMTRRGHWRSIAVRALPKSENCHGAGAKLSAVMRIHVHY